MISFFDWLVDEKALLARAFFKKLSGGAAETELAIVVQPQ